MKKYFKDMSIDEKLDIIMNNEELRNKEGEYYYEDLMFSQEEEGKLMLGKDWYNYIDMRDNYSSFFLILKDWHKFIDNVDKDYLSQEGIDLYDEIIKIYDEWGNMVIYTDEDEEKQEQLEEQLEDKCKDLLKICEKCLHQYEDFTEDDLKYQVQFRLEEYSEEFDDYYIIDDDTSKVYQDISYTKTYC